jgi:hypothetical protein
MVLPPHILLSQDAAELLHVRLLSAFGQQW